MVRLILVRHGETDSNVRGLLDSAPPGPDLNPTGRDQASALVERLGGETIARVVASPSTRTVSTAGPVAAARGLTVRTAAGLREVQAGDLEGRDDRDAVRAYLATVGAWLGGDLDARLPGSPDDGHAFFARFDAAVADAVRDASGTVLVVSHGAAIRTWAGVRATNLPDGHGRDHGLPNTGVVVLEGEPARWRALAWQDDRFGDAEEDPTGAAVAP